MRGEVDNVTIPHGPYEFHTHPSLCTNGRCALGIPSVADIIIHLEDVNTDNLANIVFEKDGVWLMIPSAHLRGAAKTHLVKNAKKHTEKMLQLLSQFNMHDYANSYKKLATRWLHEAHKVGIHMVFVPIMTGQSSPFFTVPVLCKQLPSSNAR